MKCQGCKDQGCIFQLTGTIAIDECPCQECLIKMICETTCENLKKHYERTFGIINHIGEKKCPKKINRKLT